MNSTPGADHIATIRAALQFAMTTTSDIEFAAKCAIALRDMDSVEARQWTPIAGHIILCMSGEIQDVQAHSIGGVELPTGMAVCKLTQPNWDDAPSWSNWWSVSADGRSWWHQAKPEEDATGFVGGWKGQYAGYVYPDWRLSLRERVPTGEPSEVSA